MKLASKVDGSHTQNASQFCVCLSGNSIFSVWLPRVRCATLGSICVCLSGNAMKVSLVVSVHFGCGQRPRCDSVFVCSRLKLESRPRLCSTSRWNTSIAGIEIRSTFRVSRLFCSRLGGVLRSGKAHQMTRRHFPSRAQRRDRNDVINRRPYDEFLIRRSHS